MAAASGVSTQFVLVVCFLSAGVLTSHFILPTFSASGKSPGPSSPKRVASPTSYADSRQGPIQPSSRGGSPRQPIASSSQPKAPAPMLPVSVGAPPALRPPAEPAEIKSIAPPAHPKPLGDVCGVPELWSCREYPRSCAFVYHAYATPASAIDKMRNEGRLNEHMWMAWLSASQLRQYHPHNPIILATNMPDVGKYFPSGVFDEIIQDKAEYVAKALPLLKTEHHLRTIFLDTDTEITGPLHEVFDALRHYDIAVVPESGSFRGIQASLYSQVLFNTRGVLMPTYPGVRAKYMPRTNSRMDFDHWYQFEQQYNTGMIGYRSSSSCVTDFIRYWDNNHRTTHCRDMAVVWDQCSFPHALRGTGVRVGTLGDVFNFRQALGGVCGERNMTLSRRVNHNQIKGKMLTEIDKRIGSKMICFSNAGGSQLGTVNVVDCRDKYPFLRPTTAPTTAPKKP